jgi:hypothetical protein
MELGPSFHGLPLAASALLRGRTLTVTEIFSIFFVYFLFRNLNLRSSRFASCLSDPLEAPLESSKSKRGKEYSVSCDCGI